MLDKLKILKHEVSQHWISTETPEDIQIVGEEILVFDGCDHHIDYVEICAETGNYYMANDTQPTHWMPLTNPPHKQPTEDSNVI